MKISDLLVFSFNSLLKRKFRTFLTVLGVIIGTISIVVMISLGMGMKASIMGSMDSFGNMKMIELTINEYEMQNMDDKDKVFLDDALVENIKTMDHVDYVVPVLRIDAMLNVSKYASYVTIEGISRENMEKMDLEVGEGRFPGNESNELLVGSMIASGMYEKKTNVYTYYEYGILPEVDFLKDDIVLFFDLESYWSQGSTDANGNPVKAPKKHRFKGVGLTKGGPDEYDINSFSIFCDIDVLKKNLQKEFKNKPIPGQPVKKSGKPYKEMYYSVIKIYVDDMSNVMDLQKQLSDMGFIANAEAEWIESQMSVMNIIQIVLGGIGGVSLFVAAIGITNTMSMSIYERTREIGIMKVIGCKIRDIQAMFLIEAGFIGFIGGVIGVSISYLLSFLMNKFLVNVMGELGFDKISIIPVWLAFASILFAVLIGMLAGFFPSVRAMKLSPLTAIKNE